MHLLNLPNEILVLIPEHVNNIADLNNAASSCRRLHTIFTTISPKIILRLAAASEEYFRPHPHLLIAATVRQVSDWARLSPLNTITLRKGLDHGLEALLDLCLSKASLTFDDIRRLHAVRRTTIKPLSHLMNRCAGSQWYSTANFARGVVSDGYTVDHEPKRALFQVAIYGELFSSAFDEVINPVGPTASPPCFDLVTRLDYWRYCVPSWQYWRANSETSQQEKWTGEDPRGDLDTLEQVLTCRTWREAWKEVRGEVGPDFEEDWRQELWASGVQLQGLRGLEMLAPGGSEKWRTRLDEMRKEIESLDSKYRPKASSLASEAPIMAREVRYVKRH